MFFHEFKNPIPLNTSLGAGLAIGFFSYGSEHSIHWLVCLDHNGQWWEIPNPQVRGQRNWSMGRPMVEYPKPSVTNDTARKHPATMQKPNGQ